MARTLERRPTGMTGSVAEVRPSPSARAAGIASRVATSVGAPVIVAALPLLAVIVHALSQIHRTPLEAGDYALLELGARSALHGVQRLGPYSRFGWNHPGPATFYVSAPFYALSGQRTEGVAIATLVVNLAAIAGMVVVARRAAGAAAGWAVAVVSLFALELGGATWLDHPWNPLTVILPLALFAALGAGAVAGVTWTVPVAALAGSFAVQTHVGTAPVVGLVAMAVVPLAVWRSRDAQVAWRKPFLAAGLVLVAMWFLPVVQELTGHPGNLTSLVRFFTSRHGSGHPLSRTLAVTGPQLTLTRGHLFGSLTTPTAGFRLTARTGAKLALLLGAVVAALVVNVFRRRWFGVGLSAAGLAGAAGAVLASTRVVGPLLGYLTSSALSVGLVLWSAVAVTVAMELAAVLRRLPDLVRLALVVAMMTVLAAGSVVLTQRAYGDNLFAPPTSNPNSVQLVAEIRAAARARPGRAVYLEPQRSSRTWSLVALVANQLERAGVKVRTPRVWEFMFGPQRTGGPEHAVFIRFVDVGKRPTAVSGRLLGQVGFIRAYLEGT